MIRLKNTQQVSLITTYRCNAKCHMCNIWRHPSNPEQEIDPMYYEKLPNGLRINITGGEPMLRDDIDDIFKILHPKSNLLELSTNGYYTDKIVKIAENHPNILIRISIEGLPCSNDKLRGIQNGFDHALRTILELKKTKCRNIGFSIVICDKNADDLIHLYELCAHLDIELGNSVMHNSWYFHKHDNELLNSQKAAGIQKEFVKTLLCSTRASLKARLKDYGRAWFNKSIVKRFEGEGVGYRPPCGALKDFYFIDPFGNVSPCNGTDQQWIIGNIKESTISDIMACVKAKEIEKKVRACKKDCCFIVTDRHDMLRKPWKPLSWIISNKLRIKFDLPVKI